MSGPMPAKVAPEAPRKMPTKAALEAVLREQGGNLARTAAVLGLSRPTVYKYVWTHGLQKLAGLTHGKLAPLPPELRAPVSVRLTGARWAWARHVAIDMDCAPADVIEAALDLLREKIEGQGEEAAR